MRPRCDGARDGWVVSSCRPGGDFGARGALAAGPGCCWAGCCAAARCCPRSRIRSGRWCPLIRLIAHHAGLDCHWDGDPARWVSPADGLLPGAPVGSWPRTPTRQVFAPSPSPFSSTPPWRAWRRPPVQARPGSAWCPPWAGPRSWRRSRARGESSDNSAAACPVRLSRSALISVGMPGSGSTALLLVRW